MMTPAKSPSTVRTCYSYVRFSSPAQAEGDSLRRQTEAAKQYAERHGLTLDERSYRDLGVSAFKSKNIEEGELGLFIKAVESGAIKRGSTLLVENLDRVTRARPMVALRAIERILDLGITVVTLQDGRKYTRDSLDDLGDLIMSIVTVHRSHQESVVKSDRLVKSWVGRKQAATQDRRIITSIGPGWLTRDRDTSGRFVGPFKPIPERVKVVRQIFAWWTQGCGALLISKRLNERKVPTFGKSTAWGQAYIKLIVRGVAVLGTLKLSDGTEIDSYFPQVIERRVWLAAQRKRGEWTPSGPKSYLSLFSGLLKCSLCGSSFYLINRGKTIPGHRHPHTLRLECAGRRQGTECEAKSWDYERFERLVLSSIYAKLDWRSIAPSIKATVSSTITELQERLAAARIELDSTRTRKARLVAALEEAGEIKALAPRIKELEEKETNLEREVRDAEDTLENEKGKLDSVSQDARKLHELFASWVVKNSHELPERERMAHSLRDAVEAIQMGSEKLVVRFRRDGVLTLPVKELEALGKAVRKGMVAKLKIPV